MEVCDAGGYDPLSAVYHLPAYVALERWAAGRRVVVVAPSGPEGPRRFVAGGARRVVAVAAQGPLPAGVEAAAGELPRLPAVDGTVDLVACIEPYAALERDARRRLVREAYRVLTAGGLFAAWIEQAPEGEGLDFWELESEVEEIFGRVFMIAQMPWQGFSLAPVVDSAVAPRVALRESLLSEPPQATHYLAVAFRGSPAPDLAVALTQECLLVPVAATDVEAPIVEASSLTARESEAAEAADLRVRADAAELEIIALKAELEALQSDAELDADRDAAVSEALEQAETARDHAESRATRLREALAQAEGARDEAIARLRELGERLTHGERLRDEALARIEALMKALATAERGRDEAAARVVQLEEEAERGRGTVDEIDLERAELRERVALAERARADDAATAGELRDRIEATEAALAMAEERKAQAESRADSLRTRLEQVAAEAAAASEATDSQVERAAQALEASRAELRTRLEQTMQQQAEAAAQAKQAAARAEELEGQLRTKQTDLKVLSATVRDLEQSLSRVSERAEARARDLEARQREAEEVAKRRDALAAERDHLAHQVEVAIAEREGSRQLLARVEAELEQARRKVGEQQERLAAKVEEASRLAGEAQAMRERLDHQQTLLDHSRSRAEELSASAAKQDEQGRMLAEVAIDRDRLREELTRRGQQIQVLEDRLWATKEDVQKERLENVRLAGELERLREQAARSREVEAAVSKQLEATSGELRAAELTRNELSAQLRVREDELARLRADAEVLTSESADLGRLRADLQDRSREIGELQANLEQLRTRERDAADRAKRREQQLSAAGAELERARATAAEERNVVGALQSELDVKALEVEQLAASVANLQGQLEEARARHRKLEEDKDDAQRRLEEVAAEQEVLRRNLRVRDLELQDVVSANESSGVELYKLRRELDAASQSNEQLEEALRGEGGEPVIAEHEIAQWPEDAIEEIRRLRVQLSAQSRRHAEQVARRDADVTEAGPDAGQARMLAYRLEARVRAEEQEILLGLLEGAEQKIWEMNDASDRNAARLAAGLAQLEKHKEMLDESSEELELTRRLLAAAQARALEQERLLASERAKLARAGIGEDGLPPGVQGADLESIFADLDEGSGLIQLAEDESGAPQSTIRDRGGSAASGEGRPEGPRVVVEVIDDDGTWPDESAPAVRAAARASQPLLEVAEEATQPRARRPVAPAPRGDTALGKRTPVPLKAVPSAQTQRPDQTPNQTPNQTGAAKGSSGKGAAGGSPEGGSSP